MSKLDGILTENTKKVPIQNETKILEVYKIPLNKLFYNDKNDRIASWTSGYLKDKGDFDFSNKEKYNMIIEQFIKDSKLDAFQKTKGNIKNFGQIEPGIVTSDGRILDGNRRFTCLRELNRENPNGKFEYFEAAILDGEYENISPKDVKKLELIIQHGQDSKVEYNTIDRLVGIYNDLIKDEALFTIDEYSNYVDMKVNEVHKMMFNAKLMVDFLDYNHTPLEFHIARKMNIKSELEESGNVLRNSGYNDDSEDYQELKGILFEFIRLKPDKSVSHFIREFKKKVLSDKQRYVEFKEEFNEIADDIDDEYRKQLENSKKNGCEIGVKQIETVRESETGKKAVSLISDTIKRSTVTIIKEKPLKELSKILKNIESIDSDTVQRYTTSEKERVLNELNKIKEVILKLERCCNGI